MCVRTILTETACQTLRMSALRTLASQRQISLSSWKLVWRLGLAARTKQRGKPIIMWVEQLCMNYVFMHAWFIRTYVLTASQQTIILHSAIICCVILFTCFFPLSPQGTEVRQSASSGPAILVGKDRFTNVEFNGTFFVNSFLDDDYAGFVFNYQSNKRFNVVSWKQRSQRYWKTYPFRAHAEVSIFPASSAIIMNSCLKEVLSVQ